ncbi:phage regulatory CII family protein [bacterium]|nr:phage regulatory CII family protein [bacterium]
MTHDRKIRKTLSDSYAGAFPHEDRRAFYQTLQDAIHTHPALSMAQIADRAGKGVSTLYNELNPDVENAKLGVDTWRAILRATGDLSTLGIVAAENGCALLDLRGIDAGPEELVEHLSASVREFGEVIETYGRAVSARGKGGVGITPEEAKAFDTEALQAIAAIETFRRAMLARAGVLHIADAKGAKDKDGARG